MVGAGTRPHHPVSPPVPLLALPQPHDFELSTRRFRAWGPDLATAWHEGGLHRVVRGREVRIAPAPGGVDVEPLDDSTATEVAHLLGLPLDVAGFWAAHGDEPALAPLRGALAGLRPPLAPDPWEALVTSITAQQVSLVSAFAVRARLVRLLGERHGVAWAFPSREAVAGSSEQALLSVGFSRRKAEYLLGLARSGLDLAALARASDEEVVARVTAVRGLGRWSADWFLARALGRPAAWPAGDLVLRKVVSRVYGDGRAMGEAEVRVIGERFGRHANVAAHVLLAGASAP